MAIAFIVVSVRTTPSHNSKSEKSLCHLKINGREGHDSIKRAVGVSRNEVSRVQVNLISKTAQRDSNQTEKGESKEGLPFSVFSGD